jgi:hypothetical protein
MVDSNRPQKRAQALIFEGWWGCQTKTALENENMCLFSRVWRVVVVANKTRPRKRAYVLVFKGMEGGGSSKQNPPSKMSICAHFRGYGGQWSLVVVAWLASRSNDQRFSDITPGTSYGCYIVRPPKLPNF